MVWSELFLATRKQTYMIEAVCRTANGAAEVVFDATPWFEQADAEQIQNLVGHWGDRRGAALALWMMDRNTELLDLFRYVLWLRAGFDVEMTFTCQVNGPQALAWMREHIPEWYRGLGLAKLEPR
jgi:hypothetical protein